MNGVILLLTLSAIPSALAKTNMRVSFENILTGPAVGTQNLYAFQIEGEVAKLGPVDLGWSLRKEGPGTVDGWGFGVHASHDWRKEKRIGLVTQAGVRFFAPGVEYSRFRYLQHEGVTVWQEWDRISSNFQVPFTSSGENPGGTWAWGPNIGVFAEYKAGPVSIRGGIRATVHRYGVEVMHRPDGGDLILSRNDRFFRVILAPTLAIGF